MFQRVKDAAVLAVAVVVLVTYRCAVRVGLIEDFDGELWDANLRRRS